MAQKDTAPILEVLEAQRPSLCRQLRGELGNATPTPTQIQIHPIDNPGINNSVFVINAAGHDYILRVHSPPREARIRRATPEQQRQFQDQLRARGIACPRPIGTLFTIPGLPYSCELYERSEGQTLPSFTDLDAEGARKLGTFIASTHVASADIRPDGMKPSHMLRLKPLPYGVVHNGMTTGNFLFDKKTQEVAALIDFETACYRPYVADLATAMKHFIVPQRVDGKLTIGTHPNMQEFLNGYQQVRPLSANEVDSLSWRLARKAWKACVSYGRAQGDKDIPEIADATLAFRGNVAQQLRAAVSPELTRQR